MTWLRTEAWRRALSPRSIQWLNNDRDEREPCWAVLSMKPRAMETKSYRAMRYPLILLLCVATVLASCAWSESSKFICSILATASTPLTQSRFR